MSNRTYSDIEKIPVTNKVLRGSTDSGKSPVANRSAYKRYAYESREKLVGSVSRKIGEISEKKSK